MVETSRYEEEEAKFYYEVAVYREQLKLLQKELGRINLTISDIASAAATAEKISQNDGLVPIGGGAYLKARFDPEKIMVPIGAQYVVEMDRGQAHLELTKRVEATKKAIERLKEEYTKISERLLVSQDNLKKIRGQAAINKKVDENIGEDYI